mmetsp:Transcript_158930/g.289785  ORF Transcript_158930/g.289785 Transcript_158930/m.289785 type:complete len:118 (+) Transcript_158930:247-600(+)
MVPVQCLEGFLLLVDQDWAAQWSEDVEAERTLNGHTTHGEENSLAMQAKKTSVKESRCCCGKLGKPVFLADTSWRSRHESCGGKQGACTCRPLPWAPSRCSKPQLCMQSHPSLETSL